MVSALVWPAKTAAKYWLAAVDRAATNYLFPTRNASSNRAGGATIPIEAYVTKNID